MYEKFYGFREKPFSMVPNPDFLFLSKLHKAALNMLEYGLRGQASFTLISGEVGSGKTILIRRFLRMIGDHVAIGVVTNTPRNKASMLELILLAFSLEYSGKGYTEQHETFMKFLEGQNARGRQTILIIDEAHNLDAPALEELRMLSNINVDKSLVLQIVLVGQPELLETLNQRELRQFAQRIAVNFRLLPLVFSETRSYIRHRLRLAGGDPGTFNHEACAVIHLLSGGVPRLINALCDMTLVYGFGGARKILDAETVIEVANDAARGGLARFPGIDENFDGAKALRQARELSQEIDPDEDDEILSESEMLVGRAQPEIPELGTEIKLEQKVLAAQKSQPDPELEPEPEPEPETVAEVEPEPQSDPAPFSDPEQYAEPEPEPETEEEPEPVAGKETVQETTAAPPEGTESKSRPPSVIPDLDALQADEDALARAPRKRLEIQTGMGGEVAASQALPPSNDAGQAAGGNDRARRAGYAAAAAVAVLAIGTAGFLWKFESDMPALLGGAGTGTESSAAADTTSAASTEAAPAPVAQAATQPAEAAPTSPASTEVVAVPVSGQPEPAAQEPDTPPVASAQAGDPEPVALAGELEVAAPESDAPPVASEPAKVPEPVIAAEESEMVVQEAVEMPAALALAKAPEAVLAAGQPGTVEQAPAMPLSAPTPGKEPMALNEQPEIAKEEPAASAVEPASAVEVPVVVAAAEQPEAAGQAAATPAIVEDEPEGTIAATEQAGMAAQKPAEPPALLLPVSEPDSAAASDLSETAKPDSVEQVAMPDPEASPVEAIVAERIESEAQEIDAALTEPELAAEESMAAAPAEQVAVVSRPVEVAQAETQSAQEITDEAPLPARPDEQHDPVEEAMLPVAQPIKEPDTTPVAEENKLAFVATEPESAGSGAKVEEGASEPEQVVAELTPPVANVSPEAPPTRLVEIDIAQVSPDDDQAGKLAAVLDSSDTGEYVDAFKTLFGAWDLDYSQLTGRAPCHKAFMAGLSCYESDGTLGNLRRLNMPAIVELTRPSGDFAYAVVTGMDSSHVRLTIGDKALAAPISEISNHLSGSFILLWKSPIKLTDSISKGDSGKDVEWLRARLDDILAKDYRPGPGTSFDATMKRSVTRFQQERGLPADGVVGAETLMAIQKAIHKDRIPSLKAQ